MLQVLINILTPIFTSIGAAAEDVATYVYNLSGYIYAIVITLLIAIVVMIGAHWFAGKGKRAIIRSSAAVAWVLIVTVIANVVCYGPLYNNVSPILNGSVATVSDESASNSKDVIKEVGEEGIVLAKNDGILPVSDTKNLNVFGWASSSPIYGGTGSGSSDSSTAVNIYQSLEDAGFSLNEELKDLYLNYELNRDAGENVVSVTFTDWSLPEPTVDNYTDELMANAKDFSDTALIVLGRSGGEGQDEPADMKAVIDGTYDPRDEVANGNEKYNYFACSYTNNSPDYDDFDEGESYLELSNTEEAMIDKVCSEFDKVVLVVNANNAMELGWVNDYSSIQAVLLVPGTGNTGMEALGEIISGAVNPSGRTADTYVYDLFDTPTVNNYGSFLYQGVDDLREASTQADTNYQGVFSFVDYSEGIYVGYKFYETAAEEGLINYDDKVVYPFGYGLSYTSFSQEMTDFNADGNKVSFNVTVTNTGSVAGKDVVEVYYNPPYTNGGIEKASVNLVSFEKTDLLEPGQTQTISFEIPYEDMASYDSNKIKTANGGYILEAGQYGISIRENSHTVIAEETFEVAADVDYSINGRESDYTAATNQFQDYSLGRAKYLSRADGFANYEEATAGPDDAEFTMTDDQYQTLKEKLVAYYDPSKYDNADDVMPTTGADNGLVLADLMGADYDDPNWDLLLDEMTVDEMISLVNYAGFQTVAIDSIGKKATMDSDGTSGLNDWYAGIFGTAYPTELLIAQTWNKDLAEKVGEGLGQEYADCGIYGWYGPAMNTHRSAFTGRNFEYYSEDGVLAGYIASGMVNGAAQKGVYAYIKHFVLNDQETNRCTALQTFSDEQAIREIYMKPFEIVVKNSNSKSLAVMSSFNFIGDIWCGANTRLLDNVLRDEWGFRGMVLTDWNGSYGYQNSEDAIRNSNDAMLGFGSYDSNLILDTDSATLVVALRKASKNMLYTIVNSGNYTNAVESTGMDNMTKVFVTVDVIIAIILIAIEALFIVLLLRKKRSDSSTEVIEETK